MLNVAHYAAQSAESWLSMLQTDKTGPQFHEVTSGDGTPLRIAYEYHAAAGSTEPGLVWFPGLNSTMTSTKISALKQWAADKQRSLLCFEYSGHGSSDGEFRNGTITRWLNESIAILRDIAIGPQILVGSSMGGVAHTSDTERHITQRGNDTGYRSCRGCRACRACT